ncbi:MAG: MFS transporter [Gammaproteobacteria bacterium]|nr:MFS transporter [Gammaproteobacteria bacterium]
MSGARRGSGPLALLRDGAYLRLWLAGALLGTMRWLEVLGVALWTLAETRSPFAVAMMLFARMIPMVIFGVLMGTLADRVDRRRLLVSGVSATLASTALLLALVLGGWLAPWQVALGAFVSGTVWTMEHPVRRALIADRVGLDRIGVAMSLDSATFNATRMTGPLLGGAVYALLGLPGIFCTGLALYTLTLIALATLAMRETASQEPRRESHHEPRHEPHHERFLPALGQGLAHVRASPVLAGVMVITVVTNLFGFSYTSMAPVIGERVLGLDPFFVGVLMSMEGLGALLGALFLAFVIRPPAYGRVFVCGALLFVAMVLAFSASASAPLSMLALFLAGLGLAGFGSMQSTLLIANSAPAIRSRVMGVLVVCIGAGPPGVLLVGLLGERFGAATALTITASVGVASLVLAAWIWRVLWRRAPAQSA